MIASIFNHLETPPLYLATYIICSTYFHPLPSKKTPLLFFLVSKSQKQKKMGKTYRYKNMFEGHICFFKSPTKITTKIGELGRAPLSPQIQPSLQPSPGTWHRNGTTAEALPLVLFRFTTSRPEIRSTVRTTRLQRILTQPFFGGCGIGEASKPMEI